MTVTPMRLPAASTTADRAPRTLARAATEVLQGLRRAEAAAEHLSLGAEILATLELSSDDAGFEHLARDLRRFATILRVRAATLRAEVPSAAD